uniref:Ku domain-containing protein n=1 Tax=Macrostomum lignano TaxID=282301 RepID=A0A1I8HKG1_9PLAT
LQAESIAIILDIGPHMRRGPPGYARPIELALDCLKMLLQRKLFQQSKDEVAVVLAGTEMSDNPLADDDGNFANISLARELSTIDWDIVQFFNDNIRTSDSISADIIDGLIVGVDHLVKKTQGRRGKTNKRAVIVSNLAGEMNTDELERIVRNLKKADVQVLLIGASISENDDNDDNGDGEDGAPDHLGGAGAGSGNSDSERKPKTQRQLDNEAALRPLLEAVDGYSYSFNDAIPALSYFQLRSVQQRPWKANLELGELSLPVCGYTKVKPAKPPSMTTVYAGDASAQVSTARATTLNDEQETEIDEDDVVRGYRYGSTLVPFSEADREAMKQPEDKSLTIVCFTHRQNILRHHMLGDGVSLFVGDPSAPPEVHRALSALGEALLLRGGVVIVRRVYSRASSPRLGVLLPKRKSTASGAEFIVFEYIELAFREDIRTYTFPPLPLDDDIVREVPSLAKLQPTQIQLEAAAAFVDAMDAGDDARLQMSEKLNPYVQHWYSCVTDRALHPDNPLPQPSAAVMASLEAPAELRPEARQAEVHDRLEQLRQACPIVPRQTSKRQEGKTGADVFGDDPLAGAGADNGADGPAKKRAKLETGETSDDIAAALLRPRVTEVGAVTPLEDFDALIAQGQTDAAFSGMQRRVVQLVSDSFGDAYFPKAGACLRALRATARTTPGRGAAFNAFLRDWLPSLRRDRPAFLTQHLATEQGRRAMGFLSKDETADSDLTAEQCAELLASSSGGADSGAAGKGEDGAEEEEDDIPLTAASLDVDADVDANADANADNRRQIEQRQRDEESPLPEVAADLGDVWSSSPLADAGDSTSLSTAAATVTLTTTMTATAASMSAGQRNRSLSSSLEAERVNPFNIVGAGLLLGLGHWRQRSDSERRATPPPSSSTPPPPSQLPPSSLSSSSINSNHHQHQLLAAADGLVEDHYAPERRRQPDDYQSRADLQAEISRLQAEFLAENVAEQADSEVDDERQERRRQLYERLIELKFRLHRLSDSVRLATGKTGAATAGAAAAAASDIVAADDDSEAREDLTITPAASSVDEVGRDDEPRVILSHAFVTSTGKPSGQCDVCAKELLKLGFILAGQFSRCCRCGLLAHPACLDRMVRPCIADELESGRLKLEWTKLYMFPSLREQDYACKGCSRSLTQLSEARLCHYTGLLYCHACHWGDAVPLPSFILGRLDATPQPVCRRALEVLRFSRTRPAIDLASPLATVFVSVAGRQLPAARDFDQLRARLSRLVPLLSACQGFRRLGLAKLLPEHRLHFLNNHNMYSYQDLLDLVVAGTLRDDLARLLALVDGHIDTCSACNESSQTLSTASG